MNRHTYKSAFVVALALGLVTSQSYTGATNAEATLSFETTVRFSAKNAPDASSALEAVQKQIAHLYGPMARAKVKGVPRHNEQLKILSIDPVPGERRLYVARYQYVGTVALEFAAGATYDVPLPIDPAKIYAQSREAVASGADGSACTDAHYPDEGDFWYFWSPYRKGCALIEGIHYNVVHADVKWDEPGRDPEKRTFPEYSRLVQVRDGKRVIPVSVFFGKYDDSSIDKPLRTDDPAGKVYQRVHDSLRQLGFSEEQISKKELKAQAKEFASSGGIDTKHFGRVPFALRMRKETPQGTMEVRLYYGATTEAASTAYFSEMKRSLEEDSVTIYDGHSGLGSYMSLENIRRLHKVSVQPPKDQYQIFFFNSCTSYSYFTDSYFKTKGTAADPKGTKNLDIIASGLEASYATDANWALVSAVYNWAVSGHTTSYLAIARMMDNGNLIGILGDEDNQ